MPPTPSLEAFGWNGHQWSCRTGGSNRTKDGLWCMRMSNYWWWWRDWSLPKNAKRPRSFEICFSQRGSQNKRSEWRRRKCPWNANMLFWYKNEPTLKKNTKEACSDFPEKPLHALVFLWESADILHVFATLVSVFHVIAIGVNKGSGCVRFPLRNCSFILVFWATNSEKGMADWNKKMSGAIGWTSRQSCTLHGVTPWKRS